MNLEILFGRIQEIETAIVNATAQLNALYGHKAETEHWIQKLQAKSPVSNETQVECGEVPVVE